MSASDLADHECRFCLRTPNDLQEKLGPRPGSFIASAKWKREERGWYTHPALGGICNETEGWWWYPQANLRSERGPFRTLKEAIAAAAEGETP